MQNCIVRSFLEQRGGGSINGFFLSNSAVCFTPIRSTLDLEDLPIPGTVRSIVCALTHLVFTTDLGGQVMYPMSYN